MRYFPFMPTILMFTMDLDSERVGSMQKYIFWKIILRLEQKSHETLSIGVWLLRHLRPGQRKYSPI